MEKLIKLEQVRKLTLRARSDFSGRMADLAGTVAGALEELADAKQDKLTGDAGQVVGFNANGKPEAKDALTMEQVNEAIDAAITGAIKEAY